MVHVVFCFPVCGEPGLVACRIRFSDTRNRRNVDIFLDLIHARAAIMQYKRSTIEQAGYLCVAATVEDFQYAAEFYSILTGRRTGN